MFRSRGTSATYLGDFTLAPDAPYRLEDEPDREGDPRSVIVFRLRPVGLPYRTPDDTAPGFTTTVLDVPLEAAGAEGFVVEPSSEPREHVRRENKLVHRYAAWLTTRDHSTCRKQVPLPGEIRVLMTDLHDQATDELVEAKGSVSRESLRMALGQILDYARLVGHTSLAVLVPQRPRDDMIELLNAHGVSCIWETDARTFARADTP